MLPFIRKIRRSLLGSGSFRKYILYAIGEILELESIKYHEEIYAPSIDKHVPHPYHDGIKSPRANQECLQSVEFESLVRYNRTRINNMFRLVEEKEGDENIITVMDRIIDLSKG